MLEVHYIGKSYRDFIEYLAENEIDYSRRIKLSEIEIAVHTLQIIVGSSGAAWVAKSIIDWLKHKNSVSFYYKDGNQEIKIENLTQDQLEKLIQDNASLIFKEDK